MKNQTAYLEGDPETVWQEVGEPLAELHALLHALYWNAWTSHWQATGPAFLADHDLFSRVYEMYPDQIDGLAEKMVGFFGPRAVDLSVHLPKFQDWLEAAQQVADPFERALKGENTLLEVAEDIRNGLDADDTLTLGLDDFLASLCSAHETSVYLLQQRISGTSQASPPAESIAMPTLDVDPVMPLDDEDLTDPMDGEWRKVGSGEPVAPSAEDFFFDNPEQHEVRDFGQNGASSNMPDVAKASPLDAGNVKATPPTPTEILDQPGAGEFSTLNRYLITTEQPTDAGVPQHRDEMPKHPDIKSLQASLDAAWTKLATSQPMILTDDDLEAYDNSEGIWADPEVKAAWGGYTASVTYEIYPAPEEDEEYDPEPESGWDFQDHDYDTLEELLKSTDSSYGWSEWSDSQPTDGSWVNAYGDNDMYTGEHTNHSLFIKRGDGKPLSKEEIDFITKTLRLHH